MELKTPDLISTTQGDVTSDKHHRYRPVWFSFFLFLYILSNNSEVHRPLTSLAERVQLCTTPISNGTSIKAGEL